MNHCDDCGTIVNRTARMCKYCEKAQNEFNQRVYDELHKLRADNAKMRECLEWYGNEANYEMVTTHITEYESETTSAAWQDSGIRARECLFKIGSGFDA